ncbi:MAG: hypothetical protein HYU86_09130 [Chloroflexi bacterium]|nr:hypothetical protein [Chloroflexota bacterium]
MKYICFDLEGPLTPQDNAYELMRRLPQGDRLFQVISRYDDLLALEERPAYEAGDTLALIVPFLVHHGMQEGDITRMAEIAPLVDGAQELIDRLKASGWPVFCITTSYRQFALTMTQRLAIPGPRVAATDFPLGELRRRWSRPLGQAVERVEKEVEALQAEGDDETIKRSLDRFFWEELPSLGWIVGLVQPVGGQRKVAALEAFAAAHQPDLGQWVAVGDSITDARMLQRVRDASGLAVAFNANQYALPRATVGLASTNILDLEPVLSAWNKGGRGEVEEAVGRWEKVGGEGGRRHYHWLLGRRDLAKPLVIHARLRRQVRQEAGRLG